jgi:hypothetical protein
MTHTKGPWYSHGLEVHGEIFICEVGSENPKDRDEHLANASLISAAPEMFEALQMILNDNRLMNALNKAQARAIMNSVNKAKRVGEL